MKHSFKSISVYFDDTYNLIGVPSAIVKKWNALVDIDNIVSLKTPYNDYELEQFLENVFSLCYSYTPDELSKQSALQKYLGVKSYSASVKKFGLVSLQWFKEQGYVIAPMWQNAKLKNAFHQLENKTLNVVNQYKDGELAKSFRNVMRSSPIGPLNQKP